MKIKKTLTILLSALIIASCASCGQADSSNTDIGKVDTGNIDTGKVDTGDVDTGKVDTGKVDTGDIDTGKVDTGDVDTGDIEDTTEAETEPEKPDYQVYADVLQEKGSGSFELIYVDEDNVAELAYYDGFGSHLDQISLYTIYEGEAVFLGKLGAYRSMAYSEKNNRIFGYTGTNADDDLMAEYTYMIKDGELVKAPDYKGYSTSHAGSDGYEVNDMNIEDMLNGIL